MYGADFLLGSATRMPLLNATLKSRREDPKVKIHPVSKSHLLF